MSSIKYECINGFTKAKMKDVLRREFRGQATVENLGIGSNSYSVCAYR